MTVSWQDVADKLFPDVDTSIADIKAQYPDRPAGTVVTRFAPSPTGFLHLWWVFSSFVSWKYATQNNGVFFLRIEDTDQKREVEGGVDLILKGLDTFAMPISEWPIGDGHADVGDYGPYTQSHRKHLYHAFVKELVAQGKAYPCWMTAEEMDSIREQQTKTKIAQGIYGNYSVWRNKSPEELLEKLQESYPPVIRLRSHGNIQAKIIFDDILRGKINMTDNYNDIVLLKSDGLPTYHMAHLVDDYLMGTTHVIRGEEWLTSVPLHLQLFATFGLQAPMYCHLAPILKSDEGKKRKLSKRKDPEADVWFLFQEWFAPEGILNYLMTIIDSWFEEWQKAHLDNRYHEFSISLEKMNKAGALFDLDKLKFMNNIYLSRLSNEELFAQGKTWAEQYHPSLYRHMHAQPEYALAALSIERLTEKDPKRYSSYKDIADNILFFFDEEWDSMKPVREELQAASSGLKDVFVQFVDAYERQLDLSMDVQAWFDQLKSLWKQFGFASNNQEFKEGWYIGKIGDLAMFLRSQLCCATRTPDLYSVMQVMGKERVLRRLKERVNG